MSPINDVQTLESWLVQQGIDTTIWGMGAAKTVHDLWLEIESGETILQNDPPLRQVRVTQMIIRRGSKVLIEEAQAFKRGGLRQRNRPPSEKMRPGEDYRQAARRCLREELGVPPERITLLDETYEQTVYQDVTTSYPGLQTRWQFHRVEAVVSGLPADAFVTDEDATNINDPIMRHFWVWLPDNVLSTLNQK